MNGVKFGGTAARQGGCNTELSLDSSLAPIGWGQCVAVRAQEPQVFEPVVAVVPVDVVEFEWDGYRLPFGMPASNAATLEKAFPQKARLELVRLDGDGCGVVQVGRQRLARRELPAPAPGTTDKLRRVDVVAGQRAAKHAVVAAVRSDIEPDQNLSERSGSVDRRGETFACELRSLHERKVERKCRDLTAPA